MTDITAHGRPGSADAARWMIAGATRLTFAIGLSVAALATSDEPTHAAVCSARLEMGFVTPVQLVTVPIATLVPHGRFDLASRSKTHSAFLFCCCSPTWK